MEHALVGVEMTAGRTDSAQTMLWNCSASDAPPSGVPWTSGSPPLPTGHPLHNGRWIATVESE